MKSSQYRIHQDERSWRLRLQHLEENWASVIDEVTEVFIAQRYYASEIECAPQAWSPPPPDMSQPPSQSDEYLNFNIPVVNLFTCQSNVLISHSKYRKSRAASLVMAGYLGTSPVQPSFAICLKTLEHYHQLRLRQPTFSVQAFTKVLCNTYLVRHGFFPQYQKSLISYSF